MPLPGVSARANDEIETLRKAFVERPVKPSLDELADEFDVPRSTVGNWSAAEGWVAQRASWLEKKAVEGDALAVILEATARVNRPVIAAITDAILSVIQGVIQAVQAIDPERAPSTRLQALNTASFAIKNISDACKTVGIVGFPKELADLGKGDGRWTPQMAQQINVTVQNLANGAKSEPPKVEPTDEA